jgi:hypothetical protein
MSQIETTKAVAYSAVGTPADNISVTKVVAYMLLVPGEAEDDSNRQGHVHAQIIKRS